MKKLVKDEVISAKPAPNLDSLKDASISRRKFFKLSGMGALGVAVAPTAGVSLLATSGEAYAGNFSAIGDRVGATLVKMARDIFPHDKVPDKYYAAVISSYDQKAGKDANLKNLMREGVKGLDAAAVKRFGKSYIEVAGEGERLELLYAIEQTPFFQKVRGDLVFGLYNNKELFSLFGYEGSSWEKGGYLERGFDDINWL